MTSQVFVHIGICSLPENSSQLLGIMDPLASTFGNFPSIAGDCTIHRPTVL